MKRLVKYIQELFEIGFVPVSNHHGKIFDDGVYDDYLSIQFTIPGEERIEFYLGVDPETYVPKIYEIYGNCDLTKDIYTIEQAQMQIVKLDAFIKELQYYKAVIKPFVDKYNLKEYKSNEY